METQVTKTTAQSVTTHVAPPMNINPRDIILPSITLRQNSVKADYKKKFAPGDIILRPGNTKIGSVETRCKFIPIHVEKMYKISEMIGTNSRTIRYESAAKTLPNEFTEGPKIYRRDEAFIAHILTLEQLKSQAKMAADVKAGKDVDPDDIIMPARIVFDRSAKNAGKILNTHFAMSATAGINPVNKLFELFVIEKENEKGQWFAFDVQSVVDKKEKFTPEEYRATASFWAKALSTTKFKAHETDDEETTGSTVTVDSEVETF